MSRYRARGIVPCPGPSRRDLTSVADAGEDHAFGIAWTGEDAVAGDIPVRAAGPDADMVRPLMDNTDVDEPMHPTPFGSDLF